MKLKLFVLFVLTVAMLLGTGLMVTARHSPGESGSSKMSLYTAGLFQADGTMISPTISSQATSAAATVYITDQGLSPNQVTIQAGQVVTWFNQTNVTQQLISGQPFRIYLPILLSSAGESGPTAGARMIEPSMTAAWASEIAPHSMYTQSFTETGDHSYFIAAHPDWIGQVTVQTPTQVTRPLDEIVRAIPVVSSQRVEYWDPSCPAAPPDGYCLTYYHSEALLDHAFGNSWQESVTFRYPPSHRYLTGYYSISSDADPVTSPHSFAHDINNLTRTQYYVVNYTGGFTSTLYHSFVYSVTTSYSPYLENVVITKDYGSGESYRIELNITPTPFEPTATSYVATVYGGGYSGITTTVTSVNSKMLLSLPQ